MKAVVERLVQEHSLTKQDLISLLSCCDSATFSYMRQEATRIARQRFGFGIFLRGLIEVSSYCRNDCFYCGLRRSNRLAERYRLSDEQILRCCEDGYRAGLRTFVLQGGEDAAFTDARLERLIGTIKHLYAGAAITLSLGERSVESLARLRRAGADRYLLRHEAADATLYAALHPSDMSYSNRLQTIEQLMALGFQTGVGMMVGVPHQSVESLAEDLLYISRVQPQMIGIGPFIPHRQTPFAQSQAGDVRLTLMVMAIARLLAPKALIPATTALATLSNEGVRQGVLSGANVVMPNISPLEVRGKYDIYEGKSKAYNQNIESVKRLGAELESIGYHIDLSRGDF